MVRATTRKGRAARAPTKTATIPRSQPKSVSQAKIPRPPNSWILFRAYFTKQREISAAAGGCQRQLSGTASFAWHRLSPQNRAFWEMKSDEAKALHALKYPNYKFAPRRKNSKRAASPEEVYGGEGKENAKKVRDDDAYTPAKEAPSRRSQRTKAVKPPRYVATPEPSIEEERSLSPELLPLSDTVSVTDVAETFSELESVSEALPHPFDQTGIVLPAIFYDLPYQWENIPVGMLEGPPTETYLYGPNGRPGI